MVHEPGYRNAKATTALTLLPDILGQDATPFDFRFEDDDGVKHEVAQAVLVSNNAYLLNSGDPLGYRMCLDGGELGILVMANACPPIPPHKSTFF